MDNMNELDLNEMEMISGGRGGSPTPLPKKAGYIVYQIEANENLTRIAKRFGTTVKAIQNANSDTIDDPNFIRAGFWIYIPVK